MVINFYLLIICAWIVFQKSAYLEPEPIPWATAESPLEIVQTITVNTASSDVLLIQRASLQVLLCMLIDLDHPITSRTVSVDTRTGSFREMVTHDRKSSPDAILCVFGPKDNGLGQFILHENHFVELSILSLDKNAFKMRVSNAESLSLPYPVTDESGSIVYFSLSRKSDDGLRTEVLYSVKLGSDNNVEDILISENNREAIFGSHRAFGDRLYFLERLGSFSDDQAVAYQDRDRGAVVKTDLRGVDIHPCRCGVWILRKDRTAKCFAHPNLEPSDRDDSRLIISNIKFMFSHPLRTAIGGIRDDGMLWWHSCDAQKTQSVSLVGVLEVDLVRSAGWVVPPDPHSDIIWVKSVDNADDDFQLLDVHFLKLPSQ